MFTVVNSMIRSLCHWAFAGGLLLLLLFGGVLLRLSLQPYSLTPYIGVIEEWLEFDGYRLRVDDMAVSFDGRLHLWGKGIMLESPEGRPLTIANRFEIVFANSGWLKASPSISSIQLDGASLEVDIYDDAIVFDRFYVPLLRGEEEAVTVEDAAKPSLVALLNSISLPPQLESLQSVVLSQMLLRANIYKQQQATTDEQPADIPVWRFKESRLALERSDNVMTLSLKANMEADDVRTPISAKLTHRRNDTTIALELGIDNPKPEVLNPLLPEVLRDMLQAQVSAAFYGNINEDNKLQSPRFDLSFTEGSLHLPQVYTQPLPFKAARIEGWYETEADLLRLNYLRVAHTNGLEITGSGSFADLADTLETNLEVQITSGKLADVFSLVPDRIIPGTLAWLQKTMDEDTATIHDLSVLLRGPLKQMPFAGAENLNRLEINAGFSNLNFVPLAKLPTINADGRMRLINDTLLVQAEKGTLRRQKLSNVQVDVTGMGSKQAPHLHIKTQATGPIDDLVKIIVAQIPNGKFDLQNLSGTHQLEGTMDLPLGNDTSFDKAKFDVVASVADLKVDAPYVNWPIAADVAALQVTDQTLDFHAYGTLGGQMSSIRWHEKMKHFGEQSEVSLRFDPDEERRQWMAERGFNGVGPLPTTFNLKRLDADHVEFDTQSNLTEATFSVDHFGWKNEIDNETLLEARGRIAVDGSQVWVDWLSMRGPQLEILGSAAIPLGALDKLTLQLNPFKIADTDAFIDYDNHKLVVMGPSFDLSHWPKKDKGDADPVLEKLSADIKLQRLKLRSGEVKNFELAFNREAHTWSSGQLKADFMKKGNLNMRLGLATDGNLLLKVVSDNAGESIRFLGINDHLVGGTLGANITIFNQHGLFDVEAEGRVDIGEVHFVRAPLLAQILSLLSIQQLLSREEGILFREVEGVFKMNRKQLTVSKLRLSGPSLGMMFKGAIDFAKDSMNLEGKLIPAEGLNRLVGNIPLVGTLITGSQNALIAADFTVKGTTENPEIDVNPLSVITPGVIKDIFGALFGSDTKKEDAPETQPAPTED